jgi:hypothetical protein
VLIISGFGNRRVVDPLTPGSLRTCNATIANENDEEFDMDKLEWETKRSNELLSEVNKVLRQCRLENAGSLLDDAWKYVLPYLIYGRHVSPIHHTTHVVSHLVKIYLEESTTKFGFPVELAIVAGVFHDSGNYAEANEKTTIEDVRSNRSNQHQAVQQRRAHAVLGAELAEGFMRSADNDLFDESSICTVVSAILHHDDPTVAQLLVDKGTCPVMVKHLLFPGSFRRMNVILREADRLWMLTVDGIIEDGLRKMKRDNLYIWNGLDQLTHNVKRHMEETELYEKAFTVDVAALDSEWAFYRSNGGNEHHLNCW